jgi:hypothetical protein
VRAGWIPLERHRFDGHERDYLRVFLGEPLRASTRLYPTLAGPYRALGALSDDPRLLLWINLGAGALTALLAGVAAARWASARGGERAHAPRAGWIAALLIALSPAHAFWSSSAYNVALPHLLLVAACAARGWGGALLYAGACTLRLELAALAPAVGLLAGWRVAPGALGAALIGPLLETAPALYSPLTVLPVNLQLPDYLGPLGAPLGLVVVAACARRANAPLLLAAAWTHLVGAAFDDYGYRHGLFGGLALAIAVAHTATAPARDGGWRAMLGRRPAELARLLALAAALGLSIRGCAEVARWYYAPVSTFEATLPDLPALSPTPGCHEILDDPLDERSHWAARLDWPAEPEGGVVCWGEETIHLAWNSRGLMSRRLRMHRAYALTPLGIFQGPGGPRLYYAVTR